MTSPATAQTGELIEHILSRYHEVHRRQLATLRQLADKVEAVHAGHPQVPRGLGALLQDLQAELLQHMQKEEVILFPMLARGGSPFVGQPIAVMRAEHDEHATRIARLLTLTHDATPPADACGTWQQLYAEIRSFVADLQQHIALENEVLFPRFAAPAH
jgi:regulator of cell morphogenesis and NO signaling